jgi:hypothetical protein
MRSSGKEFTIEVLHFVSELKAAVTLLPGAVGCVQPAPVEMRRSGRVARYHNSAQHGVCASNYLRRDVRLAPRCSRLRDSVMPIASFMARIAEGRIPRVPGTAMFLTRTEPGPRHG